MKLSEPLAPSSIQDLLMERLDRLGPAKRVAQIASVFGRQFNYEGIFNTLQGRGETLTRALRRWRAPGIVYRVEDRKAPLRIQACDDPGSRLSSLLQGGTGANSMRAPQRGCLQETTTRKAVSPPCSAIILRERAISQRRSRRGFTRVNRRCDGQRSRRPWPIFARAFR